MADIPIVEYSNLQDASIGGQAGLIYGGGSYGGSGVSETYESYSSSAGGAEAAGMGSAVMGGADFGAESGGAQFSTSYAEGSAGAYGGAESEFISQSTSELGMSGAAGGSAGYQESFSMSTGGDVGSGYGSAGGVGFGGGMSESQLVSVEGGGGGFADSAGAGFGAGGFGAGGFGAGGFGAGGGGGGGASMALSAYRIQSDANPVSIRKVISSSKQGPVMQNIQVKFFKPPTPPAPGPLVIREIRVPQAPIPPPKIQKIYAPKPRPLPPIILRERPPRMPLVQKMEIKYKRLPPFPAPSRQLIVHRYHAAPPKARDIIIERWLKYGKMPQRQIIVQKAKSAARLVTKKNVVFEFFPEAPRTARVFKRLGVHSANPSAYLQQYGASLMDVASIESAIRRLNITENTSPPYLIHARSSAISGGALGGGGGFGAGGGFESSQVVGGAGLAIAASGAMGGGFSDGMSSGGMAEYEMTTGVSDVYGSGFGAGETSFGTSDNSFGGASESYSESVTTSIGGGGFGMANEGEQMEYSSYESSGGFSGGMSGEETVYESTVFQG